MSKRTVRRRTRLSSPTSTDKSFASGGRLHDNLRLHVEYISPKALKPPKPKPRKRLGTATLSPHAIRAGDSPRGP